MNILVVGCGKVGSQLSNILSSMGHDTAVIDPDPASFERLSDDFRGYTVAGVPIDQTVLRRGGIEACDALAAVTEDDNTNVMVCQLAREVFHVPRVLARVLIPGAAMCSHSLDCRQSARQTCRLTRSTRC